MMWDFAVSDAAITKRMRSKPCLCSSCQRRRRAAAVSDAIGYLGNDYVLAKPQKRKGY